MSNKSTSNNKTIPVAVNNWRGVLVGSNQRALNCPCRANKRDYSNNKFNGFDSSFLEPNTSSSSSGAQRKPKSNITGKDDVDVKKEKEEGRKNLKNGTKATNKSAQKPCPACKQFGHTSSRNKLCSEHTMSIAEREKALNGHKYQNVTISLKSFVREEYYDMLV
ncbi:hypothetical protein EDC94DRAFT_666032 [Helicostylum pulchrum]|nr:hypothetical protein EDC94DRAFT_666032 [Helicostylum pulchrum]